MRESRNARRAFEGPGPGYYDHEVKKTFAQIYDEKIKEAKRGSAMQPRYLDILCRQKLREVTLKTLSARAGTRPLLIYLILKSVSKNFPAPNHYDPPKSVFDKHKRVLRKCNRYAIPPPFNQTAKVRRF